MSAPDPEPVILATLPRARDARIEIKIVTWQGRQRIDIREHFFARDGQWRPTPKGTSIRMHEIGALIDALCAVRAQEASR